MVKPKFTLIPSGYKTSKVYSILPNDGSADFDFSRSGIANKVNKDFLLEEVNTNEPRICHLKEYSCPFLWTESTVTNHILYSEEINNTNVWSYISSNVEANSTIAPNGGMIADKLNSTTTVGYTYQSISIVQNQLCSASVFVKKGNGNNVKLDVWNQYTQIQGSITYNFNTDTFTTTPNSINGSQGVTHAEAIHYDDNWIRIGFTFKAGSYVGGLTYLRIYGDSSLSESYVYLFGAQLEKYSQKISSYVKTTISSTSKSIESVDNAELNDYNDQRGTFFFDLIPQGNSSTYAYPMIRFNWSSSGSTPNYIALRSKFNGTSNVTEVFVFKPYSAIYSYEIPTSNVRTKIALTYDVFTANNVRFDLYVDGAFVNGSLYVGTPPANIDEVEFRDGGSSNYFNGQIFDLRYYDENLSSDEAIKLTTL